MAFDTHTVFTNILIEYFKFLLHIITFLLPYSFRLGVCIFMTLRALNKLV
jgi:hypothetical protein